MAEFIYYNYLLLMKMFSTAKGMFACLMTLSLTAHAQDLKVSDYQIVPQPLQIDYVKNQSGFELNAQTRIYYAVKNEKMERNAQFLANYIKRQTGLELTVTNKRPSTNYISLALGLKDGNKEAYALEVSDKQINLQGVSEAGVFYAMQTLRKMIPVSTVGKIKLADVKISDSPRFGYRGMMLDVSRHFFTIDEVKEYIDMLALHNMNRFHWHLTDDQGWRIEIKKYPRLTEVGSIRKETLVGRYGSGIFDQTPYGGYYTQAQIKEIVKYAADRYITVIPEIDLPGHMQAALYAYPELGCTGGPYEVRTIWGISDDVLCAGNDKTLQFIKDVLDEVTQLFPSQYIHIGGDECPRVRWEKCPKCQAKIKELGLVSDEHHTKEQRLQSYITQEAEKFLSSKGRRLIGWNEILEGGLAPNATVMSWIGEAGGIEAAKMGHDVIMTPNTYLYFDYYQAANQDAEPLAIGGYLPLQHVYGYEPLPSVLTKEQQKYIIGVQANIWTEYIGTFKKVQYMAMPRMAALCEVQWSVPEKKDFDGFLGRMHTMVNLYDKLQWNYAPTIFDAAIVAKPDEANNCYEVTLKAMPGATIYYTTNGQTPTEKSFLYTKPFKVMESGVVKAWTVYSDLKGRVVSQTFTFPVKNKDK